MNISEHGHGSDDDDDDDNNNDGDDDFNGDGDYDRGDDDAEFGLSIELLLVLGEDMSSKFVFDNCQVRHANNCTSVMLPEECCQNRLGDADGSNACVLISLLFGFSFLQRCNVEDVRHFNPNALFKTLLPLFCGAIELGNFVYDKYNCNGLLLVQEALKLLSPDIQMDVIDEQNFQVNNQSTMDFLRNLPSENTSGIFTVLVIGANAFPVFNVNGKLLIVDSHGNGQFGGKFVLFDPLQCMTTDVLSRVDNSFGYACSVRLNV